MLTQNNSSVITERTLQADFAVVGGGLAGLCAAVAAARHGLHVILIQDRPVLGGNASSECRMGILGALGDDCKETGLLEELQLDNIYRNPLMRYTLWDDAMYSLAVSEPNLTLLLNTAVEHVETHDSRIMSVTAWNSSETCRYTVQAPLFADCSGDGILRLSGADYRIGREDPAEFNETFTMTGNDNRTMGNSILLQLRHTDQHRPFIPPPWAHHFTDKDFEIPETDRTDGLVHSFKRLYPEDNNFWWIEYGGNISTIGDANAIQRELKAIAYGVWEYMKNHPDGRCRDYDLDWIGSLPGKRESTRYVGDYILSQDDIMSGGHFHDVVCYGGWTLDDHHPDAFYRKGFLSTHHTPPSPFGIPYRCLYSRNIDNLFFAGRDISCTHLGLSSTRVMGTCALMGQAVGTAAAIASAHAVTPRAVGQSFLTELQQTLEDDDVMLPFRWRTPSALTQSACTDFDVLRNGIDRNWNGADNGAWLEPGAAADYSWTSPQRLSGARIIFDTELNVRGKRMRKLEATTDVKPMPPMLARSCRLEACINGAWHTITTLKDIHHRMERVSFPPVSATALRLVINETWGAPKAHVFALDAL